MVCIGIPEVLKKMGKKLTREFLCTLCHVAIYRIIPEERSYRF